MSESKRTGKRTSPSVERQLALALVAVIEEAGHKSTAPIESVAAARELLKANGYGELESIPTRVKRIKNEIIEAVAAQDGAKLAQLGAMLDRAKKGLPPLSTEKKTRAPRKPKTETPPAEKKRRKKDKKVEVDDPALRDDRRPESLTEPADIDGDPAWLTRHPEPKD